MAATLMVAPWLVPAATGKRQPPVTAEKQAGIRPLGMPARVSDMTPSVSCKQIFRIASVR
jgi:hypothetical protein